MSPIWSASSISSRNLSIYARWTTALCPGSAKIRLPRWWPPYSLCGNSKALRPVLFSSFPLKAVVESAAGTRHVSFHGFFGSVRVAGGDGFEDGGVLVDGDARPTVGVDRLADPYGQQRADVGENLGEYGVVRSLGQAQVEGDVGLDDVLRSGRGFLEPV